MASATIWPRSIACVPVSTKSGPVSASFRTKFFSVSTKFRPALTLGWLDQIWPVWVKIGLSTARIGAELKHFWARRLARVSRARSHVLATIVLPPPSGEGPGVRAERGGRPLVVAPFLPRPLEGLGDAALLRAPAPCRGDVADRPHSPEAPAPRLAEQVGPRTSSPMVAPGTRGLPLTEVNRESTPEWNASRSRVGPESAPSRP